LHAAKELAKGLSDTRLCPIVGPLRETEIVTCSDTVGTIFPVNAILSRSQ
jgi:hypothetical protein